MADLCNLGEKQAEGLLEREKKKKWSDPFRIFSFIFLSLYYLK